MEHTANFQIGAYNTLPSPSLYTAAAWEDFNLPTTDQYLASAAKKLKAKLTQHIASHWQESP